MGTAEDNVTGISDPSTEKCSLGVCSGYSEILQDCFTEHLVTITQITRLHGFQR